MDRATKLFVVGWACTALAAEIWLLGGGWRFPLFALSAFTLAAVLTAFDRRAISFVLALTYVCLALIYLYTGRRFTLYDAVWMAGLLGALAPAGVRTGWHIPGPWRGALVCWALVVVVGASIVVVREVDFTPALIHVSTISNTARGGWPAFIVRFVLHSALVLVLGILWFDWLFGMPRIDFHEVVAGPLAASALGMAVVAIYQLFVDVRFMNPTVYASLGRAAGTLFDANVCGTVAALWIGGAVLWANQLGRWRPHVTIGGMTIGWLTVWASGSRTAFAAAVLVTGFSLVTLYAERRRQSAGRALPHVAIAAAGLLGLVALLASADLGVVGPARRLWATLPEPSVESVRQRRPGDVESERLWVGIDRDDSRVSVVWRRCRVVPESSPGVRCTDGRAAAAPGQRAELVPASVRRIRPVRQPGVDRMGRPVRRVRAEGPQRRAAGRVDRPRRAGGVCLDLAPGHAGPGDRCGDHVLDDGVLVRLAGRRAAAGADQAAGVGGDRRGSGGLCRWHRVGRRERTARPGARGAGRLGVHAYGFYPPERGEDGSDYRWTRQRAVTVIDAPARWLALTLSVNPLRIAGGPSASGISNTPIRPVDVKVWRDRQLVVEEHLTSTAPVTQYISVPGGRQRILLETWVSRVTRPRDIGVAGDRELGLLVKWDFLDAPPAGRATDAERR